MEKSLTEFDVKISEVCSGGDVEGIIFWFYEEEEDEM
jgi:hypothetical protein